MQDTCYKRFYENENNTYELPRKKFISEDNFAKDMAAMSLYSQKSDRNQETRGSKSDVVRIDDINQFLAENKDSEEDFMSVNQKVWVDDSGLPLEICPGTQRPRVPNFILENSSLTDPRDKIALKDIMKPKVYIEILNQPIEHSFPTDMDLD